MLSKKVLNNFRVKILPSLRMKRGPGLGPRMAKYGKIASTGHRKFPVFPKIKVTPFRKGSVFIALL